MTTAMAMSGYKGARPPGWFSRRHPTNEQHVLAQQRWRDERSKDARRRRAKERKAIDDAWKEKLAKERRRTA